MTPRNLIKRLKNIFKCPNNTFEIANFIYLGAQLILPHYLTTDMKKSHYFWNGIGLEHHFQKDSQ